MAVEFKVGDLVWARMKGFPAWPGRVIEPKAEVKKPAKKGNFVFVFFFGSENYAWISTDSVWPFRQNKDKFNLTTRTPKFFKEALEAADEAASHGAAAGGGGGAEAEAAAAGADKENGAPGLLPSIDDELQQMFPDRTSSAALSPPLLPSSPAKPARQRSSAGGPARRGGSDVEAGIQEPDGGEEGSANKEDGASVDEASSVRASASAVNDAVSTAAAAAHDAATANGDGPDDPLRDEAAAAIVNDGHSTPQPSTSRARGKGGSSRRRGAVVVAAASSGGSMPSSRRAAAAARARGGATGVHSRTPQGKKPVGQVVAGAEVAAGSGDGALESTDMAASVAPVKKISEASADDSATVGKEPPANDRKAGKRRGRAQTAADGSGGDASAAVAPATSAFTLAKRGRSTATQPDGADPAGGAVRSKRPRVISPRRAGGGGPPAPSLWGPPPVTETPSKQAAATQADVGQAANSTTAVSPRRRAVKQGRRRSSSDQRQSSRLSSSSPLRRVRVPGIAVEDSVQASSARSPGPMEAAAAAVKSPGRRRQPSSSTDRRDKFAVEGAQYRDKDRLVGFLGLGIMGTKMAQRLMQVGYQLLVWNRTQARCDDLVAQGARFGETPADVVRQCDVTFSCVSDPFALKELVFGDCGVLEAISPGKLFVDMSTVDIDTTKDIDEAITGRGGAYVEAPIMGGHVHGSKQAAAADLVALAGGSVEAVRRCHGHLAAMAGKVMHVGDVGCGARMKLCTSAVLGVTAAAIAECATLAERLGLKRSEFFDVLCPAMRVFEASGDSTRAPARADASSAGPSTIVDAMIASDFDVDFALKHQQKDLRLTIDMADMVDKPMLVTAAANELYKLAKSRGYGSMDVSAIWKAAQQQQ